RSSLRLPKPERRSDPCFVLGPDGLCHSGKKARARAFPPRSRSGARRVARRGRIGGAVVDARGIRPVEGHPTQAMAARSCTGHLTDEGARQFENCAHGGTPRRRVTTQARATTKLPDDLLAVRHKLEQLATEGRVD